MSGEDFEAGEEDGSPLLVYDGETADVNYPVATLALAGGGHLEVVQVCELDDRILVAVPQVAWNRRAGPRKLPPGSLVKATAVEVAGAPREDRGHIAAGARVKIWLGFLDPERVAALSFEEPGVEIEYKFVAAGGDAGFLPHSDALMEVAKDKFQFHTASENPAPLPVADPMLEARMGKLEQAMAAMATSLKTLAQSSKAATPTPPTAAPRQDAPARERQQREPTLTYPGLDAGVVRSALAAGVDAASLEDMSRLLAGNPAKQLRDPGPKKAPLKTALEESGDENVAEDTGAGAGFGSPAPPLDPMAEAVLRLTTLVEEMHSQKAKRGSSLEQALDGASAGSGGEGGGISSRKNSMARRALRQALLETPEEISNVIERLMLEDLTSRTLTPGMPRPELSARAWLESRSRLTNFPAAVRNAWGAGGILDSLIQGRPKEARARACLMILQADQVAIDKGQWNLAAEASLELPPPFHAFAAHVAPDPSEQPLSRLMEPRWGEIFLHQIKETDEYHERCRKLGNKAVPPSDAPQETQPKAKPKAKAKAGPEALA